MSPRRGNLASPLSLFSHRATVCGCSSKCSSVSTDSYCGGACWPWCFHLGSFLKPGVWGGTLVIGWDLAVHSVSNSLAHTQTGSAPPCPGLPVVSSETVWMRSTLLGSARLGTLRRLCSFSLRPLHCHSLFWKMSSCLFSRQRSSNMFCEHLVLSKAWVMVGIVSSWGHISVSGVIRFSCH